MMMRWAAMAALVFAVGCVDGTNTTPIGPQPEDLGPDENDNTLCRADLAVTGSFVSNGEGPPGEDGCRPAGTWTVSVTVSDVGNCDPATVEGAIEAEYVYIVNEDVDGIQTYSYPAGANPDLFFLKVTADGSDCSGSFEHFSEDGAQFTLLRPYLAEGATELNGIGTFEIYPESQL